MKHEAAPKPRLTDADYRKDYLSEKIGVHKRLEWTAKKFFVTSTTVDILPTSALYSSWPILRIFDFDNCAKLFFCVVDAALPYISKIELATGVTDIFSSPFGTPERRPLISNLNL